MIEQTPEVEYSLRDDGIHVFNFYKGTRDALDFHLNTLIEIHRDTPQNQRICYLTDLSSGSIPPIRYGFSRVRKLQEEGFFEHLKCACILTDGVLANTFKGLMRGILGSNSFRIFGVDEVKAAAQWLLEDVEERTEITI